MIKIHVLECGTVLTDETVPDKSKSKNPLAYTGLFRTKKHKVRLPVFAYLIEHPQGKILVDTGWHPDVRTNQIKHISPAISLASKAFLPQGEAVCEQLSALGVSPTELDAVLITHLDVDHASGLMTVSSAKKIYAAEEEICAVEKGNIRYNKNMWQGVDIEPYPAENFLDLPHKRGYDFFGDGTVKFVLLSGHSDGMTGVLIKRDDKFVIITGDACYNRHNWEDKKLQGITTDKEKAKISIDWISQMAKSPKCVEILASHDPEKQPHIIEI